MTYCLSRLFGTLYLMSGSVLASKQQLSRKFFSSHVSEINNKVTNDTHAQVAGMWQNWVTETAHF